MESKMNTREKILTTAAFLFQKNGYHATGLNEIIKESSTPKGSLYYHFPDGKEEISCEVRSNERLHSPGKPTIKKDIVDMPSRSRFCTAL